MTRSQPTLDDAACVAACAAGDSTALEHLYGRHAAACLALARSVLVDARYAEDAVQEAFLEAWRSIDRFDAERASVRAWLLMLTHRRAVDRVRREQRRTTSALQPGHDRPSEEPGPEALAVQAQLGQQTRRALQELPAAKREVVLLAYWGGYTQREIAGLTGTPLGTVKTRTRSALAELQSVLRAAGHGPVLA